MHAREEWFKLVADPQQIRFDGVGFDMVAHEDDVKTEGVRCGINREVMGLAEGEIRLQGRGI